MAVKNISTTARRFGYPQPFFFNLQPPEADMILPMLQKCCLQLMEIIVPVPSLSVARA
jgi:hypothetical protein